MPTDTQRAPSVAEKEAVGIELRRHITFRCLMSAEQKDALIIAIAKRVREGEARYRCNFCGEPYNGPVTPLERCNRPVMVQRGAQTIEATCGCNLIPAPEAPHD